jgi:ribonuclease J
MSLEIIPIGGFSEIGRNCVAIKHDDEIVICDMGLSLEQYIDYTEGLENGRVGVSGKKLIQIGAAPDMNILGDLYKNVVGICTTHGHLDHVGAIPFLSNRFDADIHATPFTAEVIESISNRDGMPLKNRVIKHAINSRFRLTRKIEIEFVNITHSVPDTVAIVVHTKDGSVVYMNDFKLDNSPTLGPKTNIKRLQELRGVKCLIIDSLYAHKYGKALSEKIAEQMLFDALLSMETKNKAIIISTFSSHIARLKTIVKLGERLGRKVVFLGRSIDKYTTASENAHIHSFKGSVKILAYRDKIDKFLEKLDRPQDYLLVATGHQGEPKAVLSRIIKEGKLRLRPDDIVVFSSKIIPAGQNEQNREKLDRYLRQKRVRILSDLHVSGHGAREDHRDILQMLRPEHIVPTHGGSRQLEAFKDLAVKELGYKPDKVHILYNGKKLRLA